MGMPYIYGIPDGIPKGYYPLGGGMEAEPPYFLFGDDFR